MPTLRMARPHSKNPPNRPHQKPQNRRNQQPQQPTNTLQRVPQPQNTTRSPTSPTPMETPHTTPPRTKIDPGGNPLHPQGQPPEGIGAGILYRSGVFVGYVCLGAWWCLCGCVAVRWLFGVVFGGCVVFVALFWRVACRCVCAGGTW